MASVEGTAPPPPPPPPPMPSPTSTPGPIRKGEADGKKDSPPKKETPSIFGKKPAKEEIAPSADPKEPTRTDAFSESELQEAAQAYREQKKNEELADTESLVINRPVRKGEGNAVIVEMASSLESNIFERFEVEMTGFLRKTLRNDQIKLEKQVKAIEESKKLYTSKDKYEYMVKQNPALKDLKDRLGLDFDY